MFESVLGSLTKILDSAKPMSLNQWAETHGQLSAESSADVGRWKSLPYQVGIMDAISDTKIEGVVVSKSARVGYTKILDHAIGYFVEHKPSSILLVQPTIEDAEGFSKEELAPYIRDVACLTPLISDAKAKDGTNSLLHKIYPGGVLSLIGANSPRGFRRISRRCVFLDEVSGFPKSAGAEGDPVKLAIKRSEYYHDRKIVMGSTPTIKDECRITQEFDETDQRRFFVPCPHCGHPQYLKFKNMKWPDENPSEAYFECELNKCKIEHKQKRQIIEKGVWTPTAESKRPKWVGFHIWAAYSYSPNSTWGDIANQFLEAKRQGLESIKTFVNTVLGEPFDDNFFERNNINDLRARSENYAFGTAPEEVIFVTAGIDVQDNRLAVQFLGWGKEDQCWVLNYQEIYGNPGESQVWKSLDALLAAPIIHHKFKQIFVSAAAIDSGGHHTHEVYQYSRERKDKLVYAIKGASQRNKPAINKPSYVDVTFRGKTLKKGAQLYSVGVDTIKTVLFSRLKILEPGAKYIHFSTDLNDDYYKGLQSEKKVYKFKRGQRVVEWVKVHERNESLDTWVYAFAAKENFILRYPKKMAVEIIEKQLTEKISGIDRKPKVKKPIGGSGWVNSY
jgi:phage terminase large subunit GpA-like protein